MTTFSVVVLWFGSFAYSLSDDGPDWRRAAALLATTATAVLVVLGVNGVLP